jgi:hypothetical protein
MYLIVGDWAIDRFGNVGQVREIRPDGLVLEIAGQLSVSGARYMRCFQAQDLMLFPDKLARLMTLETARESGRHAV